MPVNDGYIITHLKSLGDIRCQEESPSALGERIGQRAGGLDLSAHQAPSSGAAGLSHPLIGGESDKPHGGQGAAPPALVHHQKKAQVEAGSPAAQGGKALSKEQVSDACAEAGWWSVADRIWGCGSKVKRYRCHDCGYSWDAPQRCWHRLCPDCGKIRALRLFDAHKRLTGRPNLKHLVLTLKNEPGLGNSGRGNGRVMDMVGWIRNCFARLRNRKLFRAAWRGGVYSIEFTYTKAKGWHCHIHALVDGKYVPQAVISKVWLEISGSSDVVWIARAKSSRQVLKYILKPTEELLDDPAALDDFLSVVERRHLVSGWGKWYRVREKQLIGELVCPACGSHNIKFVGWFGSLDEARAPPMPARW